MVNKLPREIAPDVYWIGDCLAQRHKGKVYHGYNAAFLIAGETASCLVETGHPKDFPVIERHMSELFARGVPPLKYLFVTHQETPHCGGLGRVLKTFPDALGRGASQMMLPHCFQLLRGHFCRVWVVSVIALFTASMPVRAEVHIEGDVTAVRLVAKQARVFEVLQALRAAFKVRHNVPDNLGGAVTGTFKGDLDDVLARVLRGHNYVVKKREGTIEVIVVGQSSDPLPVVEIVRPTLPANTNPAAQWLKK